MAHGRKERVGDVNIVGQSANLNVDVISEPAQVNSTFILLTTLNTDLSSGDGRSTSQRFSTSGYTDFRIGGKITKTGTPTDILFEVRSATNLTTISVEKYNEDWWGDLRWDDTAIGASGFDFSLGGKVASPALEVFATMTGANTVTLADMVIYLRDGG